MAARGKQASKSSKAKRTTRQKRGTADRPAERTERGGKKSAQTNARKRGKKHADKPADKHGDKRGDKRGRKHREGRGTAAAERKPGKRARPEPDRADPVAPAEPEVASTADLWLDPSTASGFAALAWLSQAATVRRVRLTIHLVSESIAEDGRAADAERRRWLDSAWGPVRVAHAVQRNYGQEQLHSFLVALGMRLHTLGEPIGWEALEGALGAVGLPGDIAQLGFTGDNDDDLRRAHFEAIAASGEPYPATALCLDGVGWAGPEWQQVPAGEAAGVAYDAVVDLGRVTGLISLRRRALG